MTFDEKIHELETIESKMPKIYNELLNKIDMYIFGCECGLEKALDLCIIASIEYAAAEREYKKKFAITFIELKDSKTPVTILKDLGKSKCYKESCKMIDAELLKQVAHYHKIKWEEKLNVYKKIKAV
jgi:hypothetical protein